MITGATPAAARRALRDTLQRALSCVAPAVWGDRPGAVESSFSVVCHMTGAPRAGRVTLSMRHLYALVTDVSRDRDDRWQARTSGYDYKVDNADGREILAYHWHPTGRSPVSRPHLHLSAGAGTLRHELHKAHVSTGFVTPVATLALLLESFAVRPRRADWATILEATDAALAML